MKQLRWHFDILVILLLGAMLLFASGCVSTQTPDNTGTTISSTADDYLFVKGKVKHIFLSENKLIVKPNKGKKMTILFTDETVFIGVSTPEEIEGMKRVKVWFTNDGEKNRAVKIENIPELGC